MRRILIVDDVQLNRDLLASIFMDDYIVLEAADGQEAIQIISEYQEDLAIILLDLMMPKVNGLEVLAFMRRKGLTEHIPVIMITGEATVESDVMAYEYGAADVIYKPFSSRVVMRRAQNLIEQYSSRIRMEDELKKKTAEVMKSREQLENMNEVLLEALGSVVEFRSLESGDHVKRVKNLTEILLNYIMCHCPEYQLTPQKIKLMSQAAALHDVGKLAIPDDILNAPRRLTKEEFDEMKKHTTYGCDILGHFKLMDNSEFYRYCYEICRWHHEKVDGHGYPDGLVGEDIPIYCQVVSVADCFDALASKRVYKDAVSMDEAFDMICRGECGAFSEAVLNSLALAKEEIFASEGMNRGDRERGEE